MRTFYVFPPLVASLLLNSISYAQQFDPSHVYMIVNRQSKLAMEIGQGGNLNSPGHKANGWSYWGGANQQWKIVSNAPQYPNGLPGGSFSIINENSKLYLTNRGYNIFYEPNGSILAGDLLCQDYQFSSSYPPPHATGANGQYLAATYGTQDWIITPVNGGGYRIGATVDATYSVVADGTNYPVFGYPASTNTEHYYAETSPDNSDSQIFDITDMSANLSNTPSLGVFQIINDYSGKALSASPDGNNNVGQLTPWALACEEWLFSDLDANNYRYITNRNNQLVLEIGGGGDLSQNGAPADIWGLWGGLNQKWAILATNDSHTLSMSDIMGGAHFIIHSPNSGKNLQVDQTTTDGAGAYQYQAVWQDNQHWHVQYDSPNATSGPTDDGPAVVPHPISMSKHIMTIEFYPNPVHDVLSLTATSTFEATSVKVYDALGTLTSAKYQNGHIDVSNLAVGTYIVSASDGQQTYHQKFVKN